MSFWIPNFSLSKIPRRGYQFVAGDGSAITFKKNVTTPKSFIGISLVTFVIEQLGKPLNVSGPNIQTVVPFPIIFAGSQPVSETFVVEVENVGFSPWDMNTIMILVLPLACSWQLHCTSLVNSGVIIKNSTRLRLAGKICCLQFKKNMGSHGYCHAWSAI
jgi:hypothetical protein